MFYYYKLKKGDIILMENTQNITYIGNYRIRYKGEVFTVPVDEQGNLYLPDEKILRLSEEQFSIVRQKIEEKRNIENSAKSMTMPTVDELTWFYTAPKVEPPKETVAEEETPTVFDKKVLTEKENTKKCLTAEEETEKDDAIEVEKVKKTTEKDAAEKVAREKKTTKQKEKEEKRVSVNPETKLSLAVAALASILVTVIIVAGLFLYFANSGFITINGNPGVNGQTIYDNLDATADAYNTSFNMGKTVYMDIVSL